MLRKLFTFFWHKLTWRINASLMDDFVFCPSTHLLGFTFLVSPELQIIFESNVYLPPYFLINADFQNLKLYFHPLYFSLCVKEEVHVLLFWSAYLYFCVVWNIDVLVICFCLWYYIANICFLIPLIITQRRPLATCWQTDRQIDILNWEVYFRYKFANQYALLWTPNAYWDMLMHIFTPCLFFSQCVFTNFQCVITLLRALSVALVSRVFQWK